MFAVNGILFNHTSPRRGVTFVEQKIVKATVAIAQGRQKNLYLGNIYSYRDFGHSKDFVEAMWLMLQQDKPDDFVIASGDKYQIKDIVNKVFKLVGLNLSWSGSNENEIAHVDDEVIVRIDPRYYRPSEVESLQGDASKAKEKLGWKLNYTLDMILTEMVEVEQSKNKT